MYEVDIIDDTRARVLRREEGLIAEVITNPMPIEQARIKASLMNRNAQAQESIKV